MSIALPVQRCSKWRRHSGAGGPTTDQPALAIGGEATGVRDAVEIGGTIADRTEPFPGHIVKQFERVKSQLDLSFDHSKPPLTEMAGTALRRSYGLGPWAWFADSYVEAPTSDSGYPPLTASTEKFAVHKQLNYSSSDS